MTRALQTGTSLAASRLLLVQAVPGPVVPVSAQLCCSSLPSAQCRASSCVSPAPSISIFSVMPQFLKCETLAVYYDNFRRKNGQKRTQTRERRRMIAKSQQGVFETWFMSSNSFRRSRYFFERGPWMLVKGLNAASRAASGTFV